MLPTLVIELLAVCLVVCVWFRWYRYTQKQTRQSESRRQIQTTTEEHSSQSSSSPVVLVNDETGVEQEAVASTPDFEDEVETDLRMPTGNVCVVRRGRAYLQCTEYELDGERQTDVIRVSSHGRKIGVRSTHDGRFRDVASVLLAKRGW